MKPLLNVKCPVEAPLQVVRITPRGSLEMDSLSFDEGSIISSQGPELEYTKSLTNPGEVEFRAGRSSGDPAVFQKAFRAISYRCGGHQRRGRGGGCESDWRDARRVLPLSPRV